MAGVGVCVAFSLSALALLISCLSVAVGSCQVCQLLPEPSPANLMPPAAVRLDVCPPLSASFRPSIRLSVHPSIRSSVCLAACYCTPGLANALATNSSNLAQNWRLMTYVWHIAKLGDLMKFIIVLVSHRVRRIRYIRCILRAALTKASGTRTHERSVGSESLCPTCGCYSNSFRPASALWSIKTTN